MDYLQQRLERLSATMEGYAEQMGALQQLPSRLDAIEAEAKRRAEMKAERSQARKDLLAFAPYLLMLIVLMLTGVRAIDPQVAKDVLSALTSMAPK